MKIPSSLLLSTLFLTAWSCKPKDSASTATVEPATPPAAVEQAPTPAPQPEPQPQQQPTPPPQPAAPEKLVVGSTVTLDAVKAATWLQGEAPESFEPGRVYIFEAWATWCGPCIRVIPHMNALHKKYYDKGLRVYGMNVFEDGQEKVANFVKKKGEEMSYPVAYTGKGSPFDKQWMKAAGVRGIPHSFVVIDGVIVMKTHPAALKEELIEKLLKGGKEAADALNEINVSKSSQDKMQDIVPKYRKAAMEDDIATMETMAADLEKEDPTNMILGHMKIDIMLAKKEWSKIDAALVESPSSPIESDAVNLISTRLALSDKYSADAPPELLSKASKAFAAHVAKNPRSNPMDWVAVSSLQFKTGETEAAKKSAQTASDTSKNRRGNAMPPEVFQKFSEEVNAGRLPTINDFSKWIQESNNKKK